uniref:Uncharacterized protein n=1 Tax=Vitis vinifera TaxID=29760 RepID=F6HT01_VITVI
MQEIMLKHCFTMIGCCKTLLSFICERSVPKEPLMLEGKEGVRALMNSDDYHEEEFEDEEDRASLNHEGRSAPRGKRRGRGF